MDSLETHAGEALINLTADIVSAHVSHNSVSVNDVPTMIRSVHDALAGLASPQEEPVAEKPTPAVSVRSSVKPDRIICLEDGCSMKMLKRHLGTVHGMTPDDYRRKWGLSADYPMVAPSYAAQRSDLAKRTGLGRKRPASAGRRR